MNDFTDGMTISQGKEVIAALGKIAALLTRIEAHLAAQQKQVGEESPR